MEKIKNLINTIGFELDLPDRKTNFNIKNNTSLKKFINFLKEDYSCEIEENEEAKKAIDELTSIVEYRSTLKSGLSKEILKEVYVMLKNRELHPRGEFDKRGRFYLEDDELVNVRSPSVTYPYSQMLAGRTSKFVKAMADKYNCQTKEELVACFKRK